MTIPAGFGQLTIEFSNTSKAHNPVVTLGFENPNDLTAQEAADAAMDELQLSNLDEFTEAGAVGRIHVKLGPENTGASATSANIITGSLTPDVAPPNIAVLVKKVTNQGGRAGRGRMYWPFAQDTAIDAGGVLGGAVVTAYQAAFDSLHTGLIVANLLPVLLHGDGSPVTAPSPVTGFVVDAKVATQRRRLR